MKSVEVELFGRKVKLYERSAFDQFELFEYYKAHPEPDYGVRLLGFAMMILDSLKPNLKWYNKIVLSRKYNTDYLLKNLTPTQLLELEKKINELEGNKKKLEEQESPSDEQPPQG